jgi:hypothetical protein
MSETFEGSKYERFHPESQLDESVRRFSIEANGQTFDFIEIQSAEPSDTLLLHFPGFGEDAEQYANSMHFNMQKSFCTVALKGYGEIYSRTALVEALKQIIQSSGKHNIVFHGDSFGAGILYDLISDPINNSFITDNNIRGAILEAPFLDKRHLQSRTRMVPDAVIIRGGLLYDRIRNLNSLTPKREGLIELTPLQKKTVISEALRDKTTDKLIEIPIHVVFAQNEDLSDNQKIMATLKSQGKEISFSTVKSADDKIGHHIADNEYDQMWRKEKEAIEGFIKLQEQE